MNNQKEKIDVIKEIFNIRNLISTAVLIMQEDNQYTIDIKRLMDSALESTDNIQRWFIRNPYALEDFCNSITFCDGDI